MPKLYMPAKNGELDAKLQRIIIELENQQCFKQALELQNIKKNALGKLIVQILNEGKTGYFDQEINLIAMSLPPRLHNTELQQAILSIKNDFNTAQSDIFSKAHGMTASVKKQVEESKKSSPQKNADSPKEILEVLKKQEQKNPNAHVSFADEMTDKKISHREIQHNNIEIKSGFSASDFGEANPENNDDEKQNQNNFQP